MNLSLVFSILWVLISNAFASESDDVIWIPRDSVSEIKQKLVDPFEQYRIDLKGFIPKEYHSKIDSIKIRLLDEDEPQFFYGNALCVYEKKEIVISRLKWAISDENTKQQLIDHEMGHCAFGMIHYSGKGIMNPNSFAYNGDKDSFRKELLNVNNHNKIELLLKLTKNIKDLKKLQQIEDSLHN